MITKKQLQLEIEELWDLVSNLASTVDQNRYDIDTLTLFVQGLRKTRCKCKKTTEKSKETIKRAKTATVVCKSKESLDEAIAKKIKAGYLPLTQKKNKKGQWVATFELAPTKK